MILKYACNFNVRIMHRNQSHFREVLQWEIFMEQELRFGLDLGQMANFAFIASKSFDLWNHHMYISTEMIQFVAHFDVSNIYKIKKKTLKILETFSIVSCSIRDPTPQDFSIMTLPLGNFKKYTFMEYLVHFFRDPWLLLRIKSIPSTSSLLRHDPQ